ncbi:MAG: polysaccharide biosynthesis protein PslG [Thermoleophilaceae bacterium]|nr:polysaccharide biosynthesis protein PslG [Thermoleophilaceae bacterium]
MKHPGRVCHPSNVTVTPDGSRSWIAVTLAAVALLAGGCGGQMTAQKPPPSPPAPRASDFVGIYADDVFFGDASYRRDALAQQRAAGVEMIRQPFGWADFVREPARFDDFVGAAADAHIRVLPVLLGPDPGASADGGMKPPAQPERFAGWAALLVQRYGPGGSFWTDHPKTPKLPITSWQVWNEPNIPAFWAPKPDPAAYAQLLRTTAQSIRKVDARAEVVAAGLPTSHLGVPAPDFLAGVYKAGAKGSFDTAAVHPYAPNPDAVIQRVKSLQRVIANNDDSAKVWVTEVGWGTGGKPGPLTVTPDRQAGYVKETLTRLHELGVRGVVIFQWRDPKPFPGRRAIWPYYAGLLDQDGKPKPSLAAFTAAAAATRQR